MEALVEVDEMVPEAVDPALVELEVDTVPFMAYISSRFAPCRE